MASRHLIDDRFEIQDLLGRGGMGDVYRAIDTQTGETVAIKALNPEIVTRNPDLLERFQREGEALRQLNHPNIVKFFSSIEEAGCYYLVIEYVSGGSLEDILTKEGQLPATRVAEIALDLADALTRAHRLGILHRDLKPANILLAEDGTPRLADFGIAYQTSSSHLTQTGVLVGTVDYLSPEVCQGEPPDECSDIWSFGVLLFELLSGRLPFVGNNLTARLTAIMTQPVPDLAQLAPDTPPGLVDLVNSMLVKDPQERISSVRMVGAELEALLKGKQPITPQRVAPSPAKAETRHNLPIQLSTFIGRENEIELIKQRLSEKRLVTLTGPGGIGKTRLSLQVSAGLVDDFEHGVWFVELASLTDGSLIPERITSLLKVKKEPGISAMDSLVKYIRDQQLLIILDNCEHIGGDCARLALHLIRSTTGLKILATSRERLHVSGEEVYPVQPLSLPDPSKRISREELKSSEAVHMFIDRAAAAQPTFQVTDHNAHAIAEICLRLDGIPLAIELAAARMLTLPVEKIAERIGDRFLLLTGGDRTALPRHQTLRAMIDWSHDLLGYSEQAVLRRLSVFTGGWTLEAAEAVCCGGEVDAPDVLGLLCNLVEKWLVVLKPQDGRYGMLETIRQYAREKLEASGEANAYRLAHGEYFLKLAEEIEPRLREVEFPKWARLLASEHENLRTAIDWFLRTEKHEEALRLAGALGRYWRIHGDLIEGRAWLKQALESRSGTSKEARARALHREGSLAWMQADYKVAERSFRASLKIFRVLEDKLGIAFALNDLGNVALEQGEYVKAQGLYEQGRALFSELGDMYGMTIMPLNLGNVASALGDYGRATLLYKQSLELCRETGNKSTMAIVLNNMVILAKLQGNYGEARDFAEESFALGHEVGNLGSMAESLNQLGDLALIREDYSEARQRKEESLKLHQQLGDKRCIAYALSGIAQALCMEGQYRQAACIQGSVAALLEKVGVQLEPYDQASFDRTAAALKQNLGDTGYQHAYEAGKSMSLEQAIEVAKK